jgi:hypothetical protein
VAGDPSLTVDIYDASDQPALLCVWNDWRGNVPGGRYPEVYFARSTDGGVNWTTPNVRVNDISDYYQQVSSRVIWATESGRIAVGWYNDDFVGPNEMRVSLSDDLGLTWGASTAVSDPVTGCAVAVNLAGGRADDLMTSWMGYVDGASWNIYFRASADAGSSWGTLVRVDDDTTGAATYNPITAVTPNGDPVVAMQDSRPEFGPYNIWVALGTYEPSLVGEPHAAVAGALTVSPNPAWGSAAISWRLPASSRSTDARLAILDPAGRVVLERPVQLTGGHLWRGLSGDQSPAAGVYFVRLTGGDRILRKRLITLR